MHKWIYCLFLGTYRIFWVKTLIEVADHEQYSCTVCDLHWIVILLSRTRPHLEFCLQSATYDITYVLTSFLNGRLGGKRRSNQYSFWYCWNFSTAWTFFTTISIPNIQEHKLWWACIARQSNWTILFEKHLQIIFVSSWNNCDYEYKVCDWQSQENFFEFHRMVVLNRINEIYLKSYK